MNLISFLKHLVTGKVIFTLLLTAWIQVSNAQDPLMAKANKMLTISYGVTNINRLVMDSYLQDHISVYDSATYSIKYSNPLALSFDYAISDYTAIGLGLNYYSFRFKETKKNNVDTFDLDTKGFRLAIQLRGMRYIIQRPKSIFYFFAGAGVRIRSVKYNTTDQSDIDIADIHQAAEATTASYSPLSLDAGMGLKFLVTNKIGISSEFGMMTGIAQFGLFYLFKNHWRKSNDNIGW